MINNDKHGQSVNCLTEPVFAPYFCVCVCVLVAGAGVCVIGWC